MREVAIEKHYVLLAALALALVPWFSGGSHPGGIFVGLALVILGGYVAWRSPAIKPLRSGVVPIAYWALVAWSALSLIWSVNRYQTGLWLVELLLAGGIFVLARRLGSKPSHRQLWVYGYLAVATVTSLWGIADYLTDDGFGRLTSWFNWPNPFAIFVVPAILLAGLAVLQRRHWRPMAAVVTVVNLVAFGLAASRTAALLLAVVVVAALIWRRSKRWLLDCLILLVVTALVVTGINYARVSLLHVAPSPSIASRFEQATGTQSVSLSDRIYYLRSAFDDWRDHPLLGSGGGTYGTIHPRYQYQVIRDSSQAHNLYVQLFAELGVVGGLLLLVLALAVCYEAYRAARRRPGNIVFSVALVVLLVHLGVDIDSAYGSVVILLATLAGFICQDITGYRLPRRVGEGAKLALAVILLLATVQAYHAFYDDLQAGDAQALQDEGNYAQAAASFDRAATGPLSNPDDLTNAGINYYTLGQLESNRTHNLALAAARAQAAIRLEPVASEHYFLLARVRRAQGKVAAATTAYRQAIAKDPYNHPEYYVDLVDLYLITNRTGSAQALLSTALPLYPPTVVANRNFIPGFAQSVQQLNQLADLESLVEPNSR